MGINRRVAFCACADVTANVISAATENVVKVNVKFLIIGLRMFVLREVEKVPAPNTSAGQFLMG